MKTHEEDDQPVRYMANSYAHDIIKEAAILLLEMTRKKPDTERLELHLVTLENLIEHVRFNLRKPKLKPK